MTPSELIACPDLKLSRVMLGEVTDRSKKSSKPKYKILRKLDDRHD